MVRRGHGPPARLSPGSLAKPVPVWRPHRGPSGTGRNDWPWDLRVPSGPRLPSNRCSVESGWRLSSPLITLRAPSGRPRPPRGLCWGGVPAEPHLPHWGEGPASLREAGRWLLWCGAQGRVGRPLGEDGELPGSLGVWWRGRGPALPSKVDRSPPFGCEGGWAQIQSGSPWSPCSGLTRHKGFFFSYKTVLLIIKV